MGMEEPGLDRVIRAGYRLLGLQTYFHQYDRQIFLHLVQKQEFRQLLVFQKKCF
jgi:ribosome-binding ATPase YchF (GTP1/OBG family)